MHIKKMITSDIKNAIYKINTSDEFHPLIKLSAQLKRGHYQVNNLIKIAKILKIEPYSLTKKIILNFELKKIYEKITFSEPGFINIFLSRVWLSQQLDRMFVSPRLNILHHVKKQNIIVDYSSPNIAKEMHVGHLRSTIIGDVMARVLDFLGHHVIRVNHIGDWGTQFGMLIAYLEDKKINKRLTNNTINLQQLEQLYCQAKKKYDSSKKFAIKSRECVVKLQNGDPLSYSIWKKIVSTTMLENNKIYRRLNVTLQDKHIMGESVYNHMLNNIVIDLQKKDIATQKDGAVIVYLKEFQNRLGDTMGVVIQKKDKGFLYATIDIACIKYRYEILKADRVIYYTDSRQNQHLMQVWHIAKQAKYIPQDFQVEHHMFGMMLSKNKKPFKTRDGNTIKLSALLEEATERAKSIINQKKFYLSKKNRMKLSNIIGISAIKYADLSKNRSTDYIFDWDIMLSFEGNTAPYIQYAYTRIISIFKKSRIPICKIKNFIILQEDSEMSLALKILEFEEIVLLVAEYGTPHILCRYLYQLATIFSCFYENCSILFAKNIKTLKSRLKLSFLTAKTIKKGLNFLGIKTAEKM